MIGIIVTAIFIILLLILISISSNIPRDKYSWLMNQRNIPVYDPSHPKWWNKHYGYQTVN
jgi:hypothetical protein